MVEKEMTIEEFINEMDYSLGRFDWGKSPLDARAIDFLNTWKQKLYFILTKE